MSKLPVISTPNSVLTGTAEFSRGTYTRVANDHLDRQIVGRFADRRGFPRRDHIKRPLTTKWRQEIDSTNSGKRAGGW
jgi:hypothetical protein